MRHLHCSNSPLVFILVLTVILLSYSPLQKVHAASIMVNATCSLADAITAANTDTATGGCATGSDEDTITLATNVTLTRNLPEISSRITIQGPDYFVSGNNQFRIFHVQGNGILSIDRLTMKNGHAIGSGGAIRNNGRLTVTRSTFTDNYAYYPGGAIFNYDTAIVSNSTFTRNRAWSGGGIYNSGTLTLTHSTFYNNSSEGSWPAGVRNSILVAGTLYMRNTLIAGSIGGDDCGGSSCAKRR